MITLFSAFSKKKKFLNIDRMCWLSMISVNEKYYTLLMHVNSIAIYIDRFIAVMYDDKEGIIPGNALVVDPKKQFRPLSKYGNAFLNRFQCSTVASPVLQV